MRGSIVEPSVWIAPESTNLQTVLFVTMVRASIGEELRPGYVCGYLDIRGVTPTAKYLNVSEIYERESWTYSIPEV